MATPGKSSEPPSARVAAAGSQSSQRLNLARWVDVGFVPTVLVLLVAYLAVTTEVFLSQGNLKNLLSQMVILAIVAFGSTIVILVGDLDLSVGAGTALVSVVAASVMAGTGSVWLGLLAGLLAGLTIGLVNGVIIAVLEVPAFIATLGMLVILRGVALLMTDGGVVAGLPAGFIALAEAEFLGLGLIVWLMALTFAVFYFIQRQTTYGVQLYAVGGNSEAARLAGVSVRRVRIGAFILSGLTVALAGLALLVRVESGQPNGAQLLELYAVAAVVLGGTSLSGGRGGIGRTLAGVTLIVVLRNGLDIAGVGFDAQQIIIGTVFIAAASVDFVRRRLEARQRLRALKR